MKNCISCKQAIPHRSTICIHCGANTPGDSYSTPEVPNYLAKMQNADGWRKYIIISILVIFGIYLLLFVLDLFI
jgi:hypothetical protein